MNLLHRNGGNKVRNSSIGFISKSAPLVRDQKKARLILSEVQIKGKILNGTHSFLRYEHTSFCIFVHFLWHFARLFVSAIALCYHTNFLSVT